MANIIVLIKQVPDMERVKFDTEKGVVDRKSAGTEVNPFDLNALEAAVQVKEKNGGKIYALSMGPDSAAEALKEAIARGADEGILLSDRKFGGADVKATAATLAAGIKKIGDFDLIFAGMQTVDGDTGQVGPWVAQNLHIPHISFSNNIVDVTEEYIDATTEMWGGNYLNRAKYPVLITVTKDINNPRVPSFQNKMKARKAEIPVWGLEEMREYIEADQAGLKGSATKVKKIEVPPVHSREGKVFRDNTDEAVSKIVEEIRAKKILD